MSDKHSADDAADREGQSSDKPGPDAMSSGNSENAAWSMISSLVAGPIAWGLIGWGLDSLIGTNRLFLAIGVAVGFAAGIYIVYVRYGRN